MWIKTRIEMNEEETRKYQIDGICSVKTSGGVVTVCKGKPSVGGCIIHSSTDPAFPAGSFVVLDWIIDPSKVIEI